FTDNRLITRTPTDPAGAAFGYEYDHFGNQTTETQGSDVTTNSYDAASQPAQTSGPEGTVDYGYDGLGRMVWRISDTPTADDKTLFFHDGLGQQITVETDETGDRQTRYLLDSSGSPLGQEQEQGTTLRRSYFVADPRGNLTQLLSQGEQIRAVFAYDPFGKPKDDLTEVTANWDSRLRFQMAPKDAATGNYNLGARLLNPDINRFIGADNYVGAAANVAPQVDPLTGNRYMYAGANPAGMIDDGHGWCIAGHINVSNNESRCIRPWEHAPETVTMWIPGQDCFKGRAAGCALDVIPIGKLDEGWAFAKGIKRLGEAPQALGTAQRFSVHSRVAAQLDDVRLGPLAGRYGVDDLQALVDSPGSRAYFDTASRNINVVQEVDGVLLRITTASDEFRVISVGRLRHAQLKNGIANGRFVPIGPGG
ncbi:MAG: RHS repeat-associated core domain-containing protein, partial [Actinomycetota bacterium]